MSGLRLLLFVMLAFMAWRIIQTTMRVMKNKKGREQEDPFAKYGQRKSETPDFSRMEDADFEDITPKEDKDPPPKSPEQGS